MIWPAWVDILLGSCGLTWGLDTSRKSPESGRVASSPCAVNAMVGGVQLAAVGPWRGALDLKRRKLASLGLRLGDLDTGGRLVLNISTALPM